MALKCFVAMAFGREDTDRVYDRIIERTLRKYDIIPIRVDRIEHNDNIDKRIQTELYSCDLALADLTYARPSVYFEAGFAQRQVRVIYTCRRDHFTPRANDPEGNLRVHFDLQMRNIVAWQDPRDRLFQDRLSQRIAHVIAPLLRKKEKEEQAQKDARQFGALSLEEKTTRILGLCVSRLRKARFSLIPKSEWGWRYGAQRQWDDRGEPKKTRLFREFLGSGNTWLGIRGRKSKIEFTLALVVPALSKGVISSLKEFILSRPVYQTNPRGLHIAPTKLVEHIFICSVSRVSDSTLMNNFPNYHRDTNSDSLVRSDVQVVATGQIVKQGKIYVADILGDSFVVQRGTGVEILHNQEGKISAGWGRERKILGHVKQIPRTIHIHILDKIQSELQFKTAMAEQIAQLG